MRALTAPNGELGEVDEPAPKSDEAVVGVHAISLNRGEIKRLPTLPPGTPSGWDLAGVVEQPASDGSSPPEGARVVGIRSPGAWAEWTAVPGRDLAVLPEDMTFEHAAALPVAGITALLAFDLAGTVLGRRVLIAGASGGVGRFAIQIGRRAGARVTALARRTEGLMDLGAHDVVEELGAPRTPFDVVIDGVGGPTFAAALPHLAPFGTIVTFAATTGEPASFVTRELFGINATVRGFLVFPELDRRGGARPHFHRLFGLDLDPQIDLVASWTEAPKAIQALLDRRINGKAVLRLD